MYYILVTEGVARQSIPAEDPIFPGVPIEERMAADLLAQCVPCPKEVPEGWVYQEAEQCFVPPQVEKEEIVATPVQGEADHEVKE